MCLLLSQMTKTSLTLWMPPAPETFFIIWARTFVNHKSYFWTVWNPIYCFVTRSNQELISLNICSFYTMGERKKKKKNKAVHTFPFLPTIPTSSKWWFNLYLQMTCFWPASWRDRSLSPYWSPEADSFWEAGEGAQESHLAGLASLPSPRLPCGGAKAPDTGRHQT